MDPSKEQTQRPIKRISIGGRSFLPAYESAIPRTVTNSLLPPELAETNIPPLGSSIIEDFIVEQLKAGIADPAAISRAFLDLGVFEKVNRFVSQVTETSQSINWGKTFSNKHIEAARAHVIAEMQAMGMTDDQIAEVAQKEIQILESVGVSQFHENTAIAVSRLQAVRKAIDYQLVFGDDIPLETIIQVILMHTVGHELGHMVDILADQSGNGIPAVNRIPDDDSWKKEGKTQEKRAERFAEYWGNVALKDQPEHIALRRREWGLQLAKVTQVWDAIRQYNDTNKQKADLKGIFRAIEECIPGDEIQTSMLFMARKASYEGNGIENFLAVYPREVVAQAVRTDVLRLNYG